jgi:hypothetical protein
MEKPMACNDCGAEIPPTDEHMRIAVLDKKGRPILKQFLAVCMTCVRVGETPS